MLRSDLLLESAAEVLPKRPSTASSALGCTEQRLEHQSTSKTAASGQLKSPDPSSEYACSDSVALVRPGRPQATP